MMLGSQVPLRGQIQQSKKKISCSLEIFVTVTSVCSLIEDYTCHMMQSRE
jgi:hypothetical protein